MCTDSVKKLISFFLKKNSELIPCSYKNSQKKMVFVNMVLMPSYLLLVRLGLWPLKNYILNISLFNKIGNVIYSYISSTRSTKL